MSIRRSFALAGAVALASSIVLGGAQGALAVGSAASPSAAAKAEKAAHTALDLSVKGVPNEFVAGGDAREFTFTIDNATAHDFAFVPLLKFKDSKGKLHSADFKAEYQLPKTTAWLPTVPPPGVDNSDDAGLTALAALTPEGELTDDSVLFVGKGTNVTIKVRVSFTKDAPLGKAAVVPVVVSAELDDQTGEANGDGVWSCDQIKGAGFVIKAPKPVPSPSATTTKPSPSATASSSPSATASPSASPSPTATATQTETPTTPATSPAASTSSAPAPATSSAPAPSTSTTDGAQTPIDFPVNVPTVTPPKITDTAATKAKAKAEAAAKDLAATGGGSDSTPIAIAGGAVLAAGVGTLVVLRRRKSAQHG
ncbi:LPXTG cell wall anchor domain-containing protein [Kitasatospora sp. NPDC057015]|uniref:LPXTG cell wall anchor domain-containing protein n=1 Tax=Kitasatospora sp. NPDC057015 TaxID=3346001 RepID=UPI003633EA95